MVVKHKLSEIAKDFKVQNKDIAEAMGKFGPTPKSSTQTLNERELNLVFEVLTQNRQVESMESIEKMATDGLKDRQAEVEERMLRRQKESEEAILQVERAREAALGESKPAPVKPAAVPQQQRAPQHIKQENRPAASRPQQQTIEHKPSGNSAVADASKTPKVHYVDTRGASVNLDKYDERMETLVPEKAAKINQDNKQKLTKQSQKRGQMQNSNKRRQEEQEKLRRLQMQAIIKKTPLKVEIPDEITVGDLAYKLKKTAAEVIKQLMKLGVMAAISQLIDYETAAIVTEEMGGIPSREVVLTMEDRLFDESTDTDDNLITRAPVVVVMGHVDHGKTSLLDAIRRTNVVSGEAGGITQHIGAYRVAIKGRDITFLDTPGHAAFTSMRARGAQITDVAILVVAADDGIMPQTIEAINHAKAAGVPIIIAVNKMDKEAANPDKIMQQLTEYELVPEEWGGETIVCKISAKQGDGIENLLEMVLLTADMQELRANPSRAAKGTVIEAKLDKGRGPVATVLVQNGTLRHGDIVIAGQSVGRVRAMQTDKGEKILEAGPSVPVEIIGLAEVPGAGDLFYAVEDERMARELAEKRKSDEKTERAASQQKVTLENLFSQIEIGSMKELGIIVKADVQGSAEAVKTSLEKLSNEEVRVCVIHSGVGGVSESDVMLASASGAIIVGFNVRPEPSAWENAQETGVDIRLYRIIYDAIEEMEQAMRGMLTPKFKENIIGHAEIRQVFKVTGAGTIAGCYVQDGKMQRSAQVRIVRENIVVHEGVLLTLKRFKDDAKDVASGYECGMSFEKFNEIKEGDIVEAFIMEEIKR